MTWLDIPPVWLALALAAAIALDWLVPAGTFGLSWLWLVGDGLVILGVGLMLAALFEFLRGRTSFIPRRVPTAFLQGGIYRLTRNPIYLGAVLVLAGVILHLDAPVALILVPIFAVFIARRFIRGEEIRIRQEFGAAFDSYAARVRRWL